ncbi:MAG TPA: PTS sugar transporter subunit IIA [Spirochaetota bacterium]|nr:PTS sugar transporter subunit IIA [Spirochaetota bacterium]HPI89765.1 PTS sugar transporter subunit IIA [Spirochaetota bacterium]HPR47594.1 PTS sugar transporter subunit IIA [Spirochaetota bacterium]
MVLSENLKKSNILINTRAINRWDLIREMVETAITNGLVREEHQESIIKALIDREKSMSTGIGNGVAIPHCNTPDVSEVVIVMVISTKGIDFESIDNQPVRIAILLLVPKNKLTQHIKTLANIAKLMSDENLRSKLLSLKTPENVLKELKKHDSQIK